MTSDISSIRREYSHEEPLDETSVDSDPLRQFGRWFEAAVDAGLSLPNAMVVATVDGSGAPSARYVLLKGFDETGFVFYTHSVSAKGRHLDDDPRTALLFYWQELHRQVRIEGTSALVSAAEADDYFATRPAGSQISAWVAPQSSRVPDREYLENRFRELGDEYADSVVSRPETWVGYRVCPHLFEFWQGRENRLHDRIQYELTGQQWQITRLAP